MDRWAATPEPPKGDPAILHLRTGYQRILHFAEAKLPGPKAVSTALEAALANRTAPTTPVYHGGQVP